MKTNEQKTLPDLSTVEMLIKKHGYDILPILLRNNAPDGHVGDLMYFAASRLEELSAQQEPVVVTKPSFVADLRKCPGCGWLVTKGEIDAAGFDFLCPRCQKNPLSEFVLYP